ncbi:hypothetical protein L7F22_058023 [Adiantum nelumboides]|nr:hypothetical protein [Adiantum nelumboides]
MRGILPEKRSHEKGNAWLKNADLRDENNFDLMEYNVKAYPTTKPFFVGRFLQGVPSFSKKKGSDLKWTMHREGLQGRQVTEALREKYKGKAWLLNDDQGQQAFQGALEGGQQASYFLLVMHGRDFLAMPAGAWYNFHKVTNYKQLTLEEAEEQMKNRRKTADGYQRWLMKAANTGAAAFGEVEKVTGGGGGRGGFKRRADDDDDDDPAFSDKGEEDADEEESRKNRLGLNKKSGDEDGEEPARGDDRELEDEEPERGDDWEHEETFTDDDEAVGNDPEEREDNAPELPAPPEIKQGKSDEDGLKFRRKVPHGNKFSAKGNVTSRLTVPPFRKKPFARKGHFANECPQRNSLDKDDKFDRKGKKPKLSAGLVPDLVGDQQNVDATELCRAWEKVRDQGVLVFFDSGARANFISPELASKLGIRAEEMGMTI